MADFGQQMQAETINFGQVTSLKKEVRFAGIQTSKTKTAVAEVQSDPLAQSSEEGKEQLEPFVAIQTEDIPKPVQISDQVDADLEEPQPEENKSQAKRKTKKKP